MNIWHRKSCYRVPFFKKMRTSNSYKLKINALKTEYVSLKHMSISYCTKARQSWTNLKNKRKPKWKSSKTKSITYANRAAPFKRNGWSCNSSINWRRNLLKRWLWWWSTTKSRAARHLAKWNNNLPLKRANWNSKPSNTKTTLPNCNERSLIAWEGKST